MIEFDEAIAVAGAEVQKLVKGAMNITLEGAMTSADERLYEVTFSYDLNRSQATAKPTTANLQTLSSLLGMRREYKVFLVDANTGKFRGFKNYKEQ